MNVPRAESEVIMRNALHSKTPRKEAPQRVFLCENVNLDRLINRIVEHDMLYR